MFRIKSRFVIGRSRVQLSPSAPVLPYRLALFRNPLQGRCKLSQFPTQCQDLNQTDERPAQLVLGTRSKGSPASFAPGTGVGNGQRQVRQLHDNLWPLSGQAEHEKRIYPVMKTRVFRALTAILLLATGVDAFGQKTSDARNDGLFGPVRSVSAKQELQQLDWGQKDAKIGIIGLSCNECEYDVHGNRVNPGTRIVYDYDGKISERIQENADGEVTSRDVMGPYGITEGISYENGKAVTRSVKRYDANGHMAESYLYDAAGIVTASTFCTSDIGGHNRETRDYGEKGVFQDQYTETYDPKSDIWTFTTFDESGAVKVALVTKNSDVVSYWQRGSESPTYGSNFFMDRDGRTQKSFSCNPDGCHRITSS